MVERGPCNETGDFSVAAYETAQALYDYEFIRDVVERAEAGTYIPPEVLRFFHDLSVKNVEDASSDDVPLEAADFAARIDIVMGLLSED